MAETQTTKIGLVQMRCGTDPEKNFSRAIGFVRDAAKKGAAIVCLPELFRSQYFCQTEDHKNFELAEEIPGRSTSMLAELAGDLGVAIVASLFEKRRAGV
ncbi:MAG: N-carbamoylputrescine amidase [Verrucomicrobiota bacterium]